MDQVNRLAQSSISKFSVL